MTLPPEPQLSLFTILRIQLSTKAVTNLVPGGSAAGSTLGYRLPHRRRRGGTAAGFSLATVGLGSAVVLNLILWVALLVSIPLNGFNPAYVSAAVVGVLLLTFAAGLVYLLIEGRDRAERVLRAIARQLPYVQEDTAARFVHQTADRPPGPGPPARAGPPAALLGRGQLDARRGRALGVPAGLRVTMNPINLLVAFGLAGVLASIPITPGGLGVVETALPSLLVAFGAPWHRGFAVLTYRLVQFWMPIPLGGLSYASLKLGPLGRRRRLAAVRDLAREAGENAASASGTRRPASTGW